MITANDVYEVWKIVQTSPQEGPSELRRLLIDSLGHNDRTVYAYLEEEEWTFASTIAAWQGLRPQNVSRSLRQLVDYDLAERELVKGVFRYRRLTA